MQFNPSNRSRFIILGLLTGVCLVISIFFGAFSILSSDLSFNISPEKWKILLELRAPRVLCCALVGAMLACCGVISQSLLQNPLACPYTLGVSQLVSLLIFSFLYLSLPSAFLILIIILFAISILIRQLNRLEFARSNLTQTIILLGLAVGTFCSSIILGLQFALDGVSLMQLTRWLMGSLSVVGFVPLLPLMLVFSLMIFASYMFHQDLDWLCFGEEFALSRGVAVKNLTTILALLLCLTVAVVVYCVGPIGFVGLIVPHIARLLGFIRHKFLLPASALLGASFLCLSDVIARTVLSPVEIPVGVVTGMIGTPVFVYLLIRTMAKGRS